MIALLPVAAARAQSPATAPTEPATEITGNRRLVESFFEDGAMVRQGWMEARGSYADWGGGRDWSLGALLAFRVLEDLELGGQFGYIDRSRSRDEVIFGERLGLTDSENGLTDLDLFGKFRVRHSAPEVSLGAHVKLPTADESERLGSGGTDYELFGAARKTFRKLAWVGNAGVRFNGNARTPGRADGKVSFRAGGGAILALAYSWTFMAEMVYETRRYSGGDPDFRIAPSLEYRPTENVSIRLGAAAGLTDGSPDQEWNLAAVFQF